MLPVLLLAAALYIPSAHAIVCGEGTVQLGNRCIVDSNLLEAINVEATNDGAHEAYLETRGGALHFNVGNARLSLESIPGSWTSPGMENGTALCHGPHVKVDDDGNCVPNVELLMIGDQRVPVADIVTQGAVEEAMDASVSSLRQWIEGEIAGLLDAVATKADAGAIRGIQSSLESLDSDDDSLTRRVDAASEAIQTLQGQFNDLEGGAAAVAGQVTHHHTNKQLTLLQLPGGFICSA